MKIKWLIGLPEFFCLFDFELISFWSHSFILNDIIDSRKMPKTIKTFAISQVNHEIEVLESPIF